jgi:hypothetical protein
MKVPLLKPEKKQPKKKRSSAKPAIKIFDAKKFSGKLKIKGDPLALQLQWRNE